MIALEQGLHFFGEGLFGIGQFCLDGRLGLALQLRLAVGAFKGCELTLNARQLSHLIGFEILAPEQVSIEYPSLAFQYCQGFFKLFEITIEIGYRWIKDHWVVNFGEHQQ